VFCLDLSLQHWELKLGEPRPRLGRWCCQLYHDAQEDLLKTFLGLDDSVTLLLKVRAYLKTDGNVAVATPGEDCWIAPMKMFAKGQQTVLEKVGSLLGDEETSDVTISVVNGEGEEIRKFYCHCSILSGNVPCFQNNINMLLSIAKYVTFSLLSIGSAKRCFPSNVWE